MKDTVKAVEKSLNMDLLYEMIKMGFPNCHQTVINQKNRMEKSEKLLSD